MNINESMLNEMVEDFKNGINLTQKYGNDPETIEIAYELQSGSYTEVAKRDAEIHEKFFSEVANHINSFSDLSQISTLLEVGVGEGTSLLGISEKLDFQGEFIGVDMSYSRLSWCKDNFRKANTPINLAVAYASSLPFHDKSLDIVLTVHSLEPNGDQEELLLGELARISRKYLILVEPDFGKANSMQKERMASLGYIGDLRKFFKDLPFELIVDASMQNNRHLVDGIPVNSASIFILKRKDVPSEIGDPSFCSPAGQAFLQNFKHGLISSTGLFFPILDEIPFLRPTDALYCLSPKFDTKSMKRT